MILLSLLSAKETLVYSRAICAHVCRRGQIACSSERVQLHCDVARARSCRVFSKSWLEGGKWTRQKACQEELYSTSAGQLNAKDSKTQMGFHQILVEEDEEEEVTTSHPGLIRKFKS